MVGNRRPIVQGYQYLASHCTIFTNTFERHITTATHLPNRLASIMYSETRYLINLGTKLIRSEH